MKFLEKLAVHILEKWSNDLQNLVVILPNNRAKLFLTKHLTHHSTETIWLPQMFSSVEFMEKISGLSVADDYILTSYLFEAMPKALRGDNSYDEFLNWAVSLLQDFKEIDHQLANPIDLFNSLVDINRLEQWNPESDKISDQQAKYLKFCEMLPEFYSAFNQLLLENGIAHSGLAEREAAQKMNAYLEDSNTVFIVAGFNALTNAEKDIFKSIHDSCEGEILFDYDFYYVDDIVQEAGLFARENLNVWKQNPLNWTGNYFKEIPKEINVYKCTSNIEQSYVLAEIMRQQNLTNLEDTAIVLADESLLIPVIRSLPASINHVNITMGYSLKYSSYYGLFDAIIRMHFSVMLNQKGNSRSFYYKDVVRLLNNETYRSLMTDNSIAPVNELIKNIVEKNIVYISINRLNSTIPKKLQNDGIVFKSDSKPEDILDLLNSLIKLLDNLLLNENALEHKIQREFLLHHMEITKQITRIHNQLEEGIDLLSLHKIWIHYHQITKVQFTGEPLSGLQIMGLLETRNLDFNEVYILNTNEGVLPSSRRYGSMIPYDIKKHFGLLVHKEREAVFAYHFYRLLQRSKTAHLMYHTKSGDFGGGEISRFLIQLKKELVQYSDQHSIQEFITKPETTIEENHPREIEKTDYIRTCILEKFESGFSPTALSTYLNCSLDFYFKYIIKLYEEEEVSESLEASDFGNIVHDILEELYNPYTGKVLLPSDVNSMKKKYPVILTEAFQRKFDKNYMFIGKNMISYNIAGKYIERFLEIESVRLKKHNVEILGLEKDLSRTTDVEINGEMVKVKFKGKIDRIEKVDGIVQIVDYKTGLVTENELKTKEIEDIFSGSKNKLMQLVIYAWIVQGSDFWNHESILAKIYSMRSYQKGFVSLKLNNEDLIDPETFDMIEMNLKNIVLEIYSSNNKLKHNPKHLYCNFC